MFTKSEFETESAAIKGQGRSEHVSRTVYNWENMKKAKGKKVTFSTPASQTVIRNEAFLLKKKNHAIYGLVWDQRCFAPAIFFHLILR